jgi:hypothetical protein
MIGTNVTNVGIGAFAGCSSLTAITVNSNNQAYTSLTGVLFNQSQTTLIEYPGGLRGNYTIPNSVSSIGTSAFALCTNLTSITIPNGVTNVGPAAFFHCINLTSVTLSDSTTTIGYNAFNQCFNLANITIPDNVTSIGEWAFEECYNLTNALIGKSVTSIGMDAFLSCTKLVSADIPNSVTSIGDDGFYDCTSLTKVTIPNSVTNLGADVFGNCTNLTSVLIGNSFLGSFEFSSCSSLTNITIGAYVTSIADAAFYACHNLMGVYFLGNPPSLNNNGGDPNYTYLFGGDNKTTVYYLPGTTNWGSTFAGRPTVLWNPRAQTSGGSFGVRTNRFGFPITGTSNLVIVVEACTDLANRSWSPVSTNTLTGGSSYFSDPQWTNYPARFYRLRSP